MPVWLAVALGGPRARVGLNTVYVLARIIAKSETVNERVTNSSLDCTLVFQINPEAIAPRYQ